MNFSSLCLSVVFRFGTLLLIMCLGLPGNLKAQGKKEVVVYLKTGEVVFGKIQEKDSLGNYSISNDCGIRTYRAAEIDHIGRAGLSRPDFKKNGYYNQTTTALLLGEGKDGFQPIPSLTMVNGWQFKRRIYAGLGLGYEHFDWGVLPLFAEVKYIFGYDNVAPFLSFRMGYSFPLEKEYGVSYYGYQTKTCGGVLLNPEAGIRIHTGSGNFFIMGFGYNYQKLSYKETSGGNYIYDRRYITRFNRISVRLGFIFQ